MLETGDVRENRDIIKNQQVSNGTTNPAKWVSCARYIYQWIATALRVRSYVEAICPEDEKPSAEIQKGYKHA